MGRHSQLCQCGITRLLNEHAVEQGGRESIRTEDIDGLGRACCAGDDQGSEVGLQGHLVSVTVRVVVLGEILGISAKQREAYIRIAYLGVVRSGCTRRRYARPSRPSRSKVTRTDATRDAPP